MSIDIKTIQHVANLARLNLTDEEIKTMSVDMASILGYVDKLNELDTTDVKPMEHVLPIKNVLREDKDSESFDRDEILKNAAQKEDGCFCVPKIVE